MPLFGVFRIIMKLHNKEVVCMTEASKVALLVGSIGIYTVGFIGVFSNWEKIPRRARIPLLVFSGVIILVIILVVFLSPTLPVVSGTSAASTYAFTSEPVDTLTIEPIETPTLIPAVVTTSMPTATPTLAPTPTPKAGDLLTIGSYQGEAIEWRVLAVEGSKVLVH